jgi:hypothetical protein
MILSLLLILVLVGIMYMNYQSDMPLNRKVLMLLIFVLVCHGAMNNIRYELLQENFQNMVKSKEHFTNKNEREKLTVVSDNYQEDNKGSEGREDREFSQSRDEYQDIKMSKSNSNSNSFTDVEQNAEATFEGLTTTDELFNNLEEEEIAELNETMEANDNTFERFDNTAKKNSTRKNKTKQRDNFGETETFARRKTSKAKEASESGSTIIKQDRGKGISSVFSPQIIIKEGDQDGVYFKKSKTSEEVPVARRRRRPKNWQEPEDDLWGDSHQYYDKYDTSKDPWNSAVNNWNKAMASNSGRSECGNYSDSKRVDYDTLRKGADKQYQNSQKQFYPGYAYQPPSNWDVPQKRPPLCVNTNPDTTQLPIGIADHGTPINALEVDPIGRILATEEKVKYTNVGSILPKFSYSER